MSDTAAHKEESVRQVVELLQLGLPDGWTVVRSPRVGNARPDVLAFNPNAGVAVYEICDWVAGHPARRYDSHEVAIMAETAAGGWIPVPNPVGQVDLYREALKEIFDPDEPAWSKITAGVVMTGFPLDDARKLLSGVIRQAEKSTQGWKLLRIVGCEQFEAGAIEDFLPTAFDTTLQYQLSEGAMDRLSDWVETTEDSEMILGDLLVLDEKQRELVQNRVRRRIRGAVGTGKSAVLAAAAVEAALEGRKVLMVVKNITLRHYLWGLATRWLPGGTTRARVVQAMRHNITILYLHEWCKKVCADAGIEKQLRVCMGPYNQRKGPWPEEKIKEIVGDALSLSEDSDENQSGVVFFDTLLVDELQNIDHEWLDLLYRVLQGDDVELMLAADKTQSFYQGSDDWTYERISGTGFSGPWVMLEKSYRIPINAIPMLEAYCAEFLGDRDGINYPIAAGSNGGLDLFSCQMLYRNVAPSGDLATEVAELINQWSEIPGLPQGDIAFLMPTHKLGLEVIERLNLLDPDLPGQVTHVFGEKWPIQQRRKRSFWPDRSHIMGSTVHSFQGWESRCVILGIPPLDADGTDPDDAFTTDYWTAVYVGLSRVMNNAAGSFLIVVNDEYRLEDFLQNHFDPV